MIIVIEKSKTCQITLTLSIESFCQSWVLDIGILRAITMRDLKKYMNVFYEIVLLKPVVNRCRNKALVFTLRSPNYNF